MRKIAIIAPGHLPIPAIKGGAVERLIESILSENEAHAETGIDLYTTTSVTHNYNNTKIIKIRHNLPLKVLFKLLNAPMIFFKSGILLSEYGLSVHKKIAPVISSYDSVIVENNLLVLHQIIRVRNKLAPSTKVFYHMHNVIDEDEQLKPLFIEAANECSAIITVSAYIKDYFNSIARTETGRVLYNCVDLDIFKNNHEPNCPIRKFIFTGRCVEEKGVMELIDAFCRHQEIHPDTSLLLCDVTEKTSKNIRAKISEAQSRYDISTVGFISQQEMAQRIKNSDCVIIPSKAPDAFPVAALEAMAAQKAIISSNSGGLTEVLNRRNSIIVKTESLQDGLYKALNDTYSDPLDAKKRARRAFIDITTSSKYTKLQYYKDFIEYTK